MELEAVIGVEIHAELLTASKIFCGCATAFGAPPNTQVCEICLGMPGSLPVLNKKAVDYALMMALAINCQVNPESVFARKNYFYPDLPKGYQISQYELPLAEHGYLDIKVNGGRKRIGITRIHLEEDAGKLIHSETRPVSFVDFNRTGVPLIEIVSEPDMRSPEEAVEYFKGLRNILLYLAVCEGKMVEGLLHQYCKNCLMRFPICDCNMEEGSLRCDANISLRAVGAKELGVKVELKNMNSFRFVRAALEFEIKRQRANLSAGRAIVQETRLWDAAQHQTISMRGKEEAHDYRYFPDPDLAPVRISEEYEEEIRKSLPELPAAKLNRFLKEYGLPEYDAELLTGVRDWADYYENVVKEFPHPKKVSNYMMRLPLLSSQFRDWNVSPRNFAKVLSFVEQGTISLNLAKTVLEEMIKSGKEPETIIKEKGLAQISDTVALEALAREIISANPKEAADYRAGKGKLLGFFVGQLMRRTQGQANPQLANEIFQKMLR